MAGCSDLESRYQYMISEVVMLRLFSILETVIGEMALKFACGALYRNGNSPNTHISCSSMGDATSKMLSHNRGNKPMQYLKWTNARDIKKSIKYTLDVGDKFYANVQNHSSLIDEMRKIRNHVAHRNSGTARDYYQVLRVTYGGNPKIPIGAFFTFKSRNPIPNINRYLLSVPVILNDISNG